MFQISKCRGDWDLGLCTISVLAYGEPQRKAFFWCLCTYFKKLVGRGGGGRKGEREEEDRKRKKEEEEEKRRRRWSLQFIT